MDQAAGLFPQHELSYESSSNESTDIQSTFQELRKVLGEIPILASEQKLLDEAGGDEDEKPKEEEVKAGGKPKILADGTYATESAYTSSAAARLEAVKSAAKPPLRG